MKKISISIILAVFVCILCSGTVLAGDCTSTMTASSSKVKQGAEVTFTTTIKSPEKALNAISAEIDYDTNLLEYVSMTAGNGWSGDLKNKKLVLVTLNANKDVTIDFKFKVKSSATVGNAVVTLKNIQGVDLDETEYAIPNATRTISIEASATKDPTTDNNIPKVNTTNETPKANTIPYTGVEDWVMPIAFIAIIAAAIGYVCYRKYNMV